MDVSLLGGWFPAVLQIAAGVAVVVAIGRRDRRWRWRRVPLVLGGAAFGTLLAAFPGTALIGETDPLPFQVWLWFCICLAAIITLVIGWRSARWWRRGTAVVAIALAAFVCANSINQFVGYYPTIATAVNDWTHAPVPGQVTVAGLAHTPPTAKLPRAGRIVAVNIPATYSGFKHRQELVYLPPIWFRAPRPALPVVEMIGGDRGGPADWVRLGNAVQTSDSYARHHHGLAPILVFTDATSNFDNDTECVNGPRGNAADHLDQDIPHYVESTFGASTDPGQWGVAGFSMGGTCAIDLVVAHPTVFGHFIDISGDLAPNSGDDAETLSTLYGGNLATERANDPLTVMHTHGPYHGVSGLFFTSNVELTHQREATQLSQAGTKVGIWSRLQVSDGAHKWQFAGPAFATAYPWLVSQLAPPHHRHT